MINIDIPISYDVKLEKAEKVVNEIVEMINEHDGVNKCEYRGVNDLADSASGLREVSEQLNEEMKFFK